MADAYHRENWLTTNRLGCLHVRDLWLASPSDQHRALRDRNFLAGIVGITSGDLLAAPSSNLKGKTRGRADPIARAAPVVLSSTPSQQWGRLLPELNSPSNCNGLGLLTEANCI